MATGPRCLYEASLERDLVLPDAAQAKAIDELQKIHDQFVERASRKSHWLTRWLPRQKPQPVRGLYFWGGVGRGKTFLMDLFFQSLPTERKLRLHFHRFMQLVHARLRDAGGQPNPLVVVANSIASQADVLCFDELYVSDIGDAMILGNLLDALFARDVVLIATSNIEPDRLYENGLQRQQFLPAIALIKRHTKVLNVDGGVDYRLRSLEKVALYHYPADEAAEEKLGSIFSQLTQSQLVEAGKLLEVQGRTIQSRQVTQDVAWFDFSRICGGPRGAADYIELARQYHTVFISGVPVFDDANDDEARRFITLVDEFYDRKVKLVVDAMAPMAALYTGTTLAFSFQRTCSRLIEMQTREYLASPHTPADH